MPLFPKQNPTTCKPLDCYVRGELEERRELEEMRENHER
jgi:hypothetical protein